MEEKNEFNELLENNKTLNEETAQKNKKILIFSAAGILIGITLILILINIFSVKKYTLTVKYNLSKINVEESFNRVFINLEGKNKISTEFKLNEDIKLLNIPEGTYKVKFFITDDNNIKYYYTEKEVNLNENKSIELNPIKSTIKYDIKEEWLNKDLKITLPENFDKYLVYELKNGIYKKINESTKNVVWFRNLDKNTSLKFSVIKNNYLYKYSDELKVNVNTKPNKPIILSPENGEAIKASSNFFFVWSCKDPNGDKLKYDLFLTTNGKEIQIAKDISSINFQYSNLKPGTDYTLKIIASDGNLTNFSSINFRTLLSQKKYTYMSKDNKLLIYSVLDTKNPKLIKTINLSGKVRTISENNNYLYILREKSGISIIDFHSPINATLKKNLELMDIESLKVNTKFLFTKFKDGRISVYSLKNPYKPEFLGFTEEKYYGTLNPKITYIKRDMNINVPIISSEYPIRIGLKNKVYVKNYTLVVGSEKAKSIINNNYTEVFENLRFIFSMYKTNDFTNKEKIPLIKNRLMNALNEMFKLDSSEGIKSIKLIISKVD
ncbi:hypothetical protein OSSY52_13210 [Tepiditoga spiralis]|uniref:Fibronectin type-III domain-containing protein n=1 Tax=Tepiditoga spiralis TaxID=2108365 RepID=A0A7G1G3Z0_9BACT|nr:hypothetical protein [Tepiditoga spiralis]BBE31180.1 hypothetical protein OSSY52_13210 [Tepiditoga spiralis]